MACVEAHRHGAQLSVYAPALHSVAVATELVLRVQLALVQAPGLELGLALNVCRAACPRRQRCAQDHQSRLVGSREVLPARLAILQGLGSAI